jgi:hypothetical protein
VIRIYKILKNIILFIFIFMLIVLLAMSCTETVYFDTVGAFWRMDDSPVLRVIMLVCIALLGGMLYRALNGRAWEVGSKGMLIATAIHVAIMLAFILFTQYEPVSDELYCMNAAADLLKGDNSAWQQPNYMFLYPFQGGLVLAEYVVSLAAGANNYVVFELLNVAFYAYALWNVYRILLHMNVSRRMAGLIYVVSPLWFPLMLYVSFVYGNLVGLMLALLGVRLLCGYFDKGSAWRLVGLGLCMGLACVLKSNYMITMVACGCVCVLQAVYVKKPLPLVGLVVLAAGYVLVRTVTFSTLEHMTDTSTPDGIPMSAWMAMGMSDGGDYGWFNNYNGYVYAKNGYDYEAANDECVSLVVARFGEAISSPRRWLKFFYVKTLSQWAEPTFQGFNILTTRDTALTIRPWLRAIIYEGSVNGFIRGLLDAAQTIVYFGALCFAWFKRRTATPVELVFAIAFIGGFIFHLFWEAKGQYTIIYFWMLVPYAVIGWKELCMRMAGVKLPDRK